MITQILKLADYFDLVGLYKKADQLDNLIVKISEDLIEYTIKSGDNLGQIAIDHGVSVSDIQSANNMGNSTSIRAEDVILIPTSKKDKPQKETSLDSSNSNDAFTHKVKSGDTISEIAQKYGITTSELQEANNMVGRTNINVDQELIIPGDYPTEVVAAVLLGEVGTTKPDAMPAIMKVIENRAKARGLSALQIVTEETRKGRHQFEYYGKIKGEIQKTLSGNMGRGAGTKWDRAYALASGEESLPDIGGATHYYSKKMSTPPEFASSKNKCWEETYSDNYHIFGIDRATSAYDGGKFCDKTKGYSK
jgi:LysM repeat protein